MSSYELQILKEQIEMLKEAHRRQQIQELQQQINELKMQQLRDSCFKPQSSGHSYQPSGYISPYQPSSPRQSRSQLPMYTAEPVYVSEKFSGVQPGNEWRYV